MSDTVRLVLKATAFPVKSVKSFVAFPVSIRVIFILVAGLGVTVASKRPVPAGFGATEVRVFELIVADVLETIEVDKFDGLKAVVKLVAVVLVSLEAIASDVVASELVVVVKVL